MSEEAQCGTMRVDDLRGREEAESEKCASAKPWGVNILVFSKPLW